MLARHRYTRCVNDVGLDAAHLEPARHPEAVTASLEGDCNALDPASCFLRFLSPSMQQLQQCALVDRELFQRLALDARHDTSNEPARQALLNDRNQRAVRLEGGEGSAQVVQLLHGVAPSVHISDDGMKYPRRRPIASSTTAFLSHRNHGPTGRSRSDKRFFQMLTWAASCRAKPRQGVRCSRMPA